MKAQHGKIQVLNNQESIQLLEQNLFGHLACALKNEAYLVPITYAFYDGYIYGHSKLGKKIEMMRKNPKVCIQVEDVKSFFNWKSTIIVGNYEELKGNESAVGMRLLMKKILEKEPSEHISSLEMDLMATLEAAVVFRVKVEEITGRFEGDKY